jgi:hypothetical protein
MSDRARARPSTTVRPTPTARPATLWA